MQKTTLVLILLAALLNLIVGIGYLLEIIKVINMPIYLWKTIDILEAFLLYLATFSSLINFLTNKTTEIMHKFLLLAVSSALFFAKLSWVISWILRDAF